MDEDAAAAQSNLSNMMQEWIPNQSTERLEELRSQMKEDWSSMMSDAYDRFIEYKRQTIVQTDENGNETVSDVNALETITIPGVVYKELPTEVTATVHRVKG
jgi:hypothetical protein